MSDLDALFRAILVNPDEDTPRLVYADALAEFGAERRADFIRGQIEGRYRQVEGVPLAVWQDFDEPSTRHLTGLPGFDTTEHPGPTCTPIYRRGFVDEIRLPYLFFIRNVVELFQTFPITRVVLTDKLPDLVGGNVEGRGSGHAWFEGNGLAETSAIHLPSALFRLLGSRVTNSREKALFWLSAACVHWGRGRAGL